MNVSAIALLLAFGDMAFPGGGGFPAGLGGGAARDGRTGAACGAVFGPGKTALAVARAMGFDVAFGGAPLAGVGFGGGGSIKPFTFGLCWTCPIFARVVSTGLSTGMTSVGGPGGFAIAVKIVNRYKQFQPHRVRRRAA